MCHGAVEARPHSLILQLVSVLHVARAALTSQPLPSPACCIPRCIGAEPGQYKVVALVLSSLAESPSLSRMSTKESLPPSQPLFS